MRLPIDRWQRTLPGIIDEDAYGAALGFARCASCGEELLSMEEIADGMLCARCRRESGNLTHVRSSDSRRSIDEERGHGGDT